MPDHTDRPRPERLPLPPLETAYKVWFALIAFVVVCVFGVAVWAVVKLVTHYT